MFWSRTLNDKINKLHERALQVMYTNANHAFQQLLERDYSFTIHESNLQRLTYNICPVQELFKTKPNSYNLRYNRERELPKVRTVNNGNIEGQKHGKFSG